MSASLELFSGTKSVSEVFKEYGFDAWSVDNDPKLHPRICEDILVFPLSGLPNDIEIIWASPDCRYFSRNGDARHWTKVIKKYRQYEYLPNTIEAIQALLLIERTIQIIRSINPKYYFIENPIGRLRHIKVIQQFAPFRYSVNYKDFGFNYSKETDIYTNAYLGLSQKKVIRPGRSVKYINSRLERARVPGLLICNILNQLGFSKNNNSAAD